jgi:hypothetical protein
LVTQLWMNDNCVITHNRFPMDGALVGLGLKVQAFHHWQLHLHTSSWKLTEICEWFWLLLVGVFLNHFLWCSWIWWSCKKYLGKFDYKQDMKVKMFKQHSHFWLDSNQWFEFIYFLPKKIKKSLETFSSIVNSNNFSSFEKILPNSRYHIIGKRNPWCQ